METYRTRDLARLARVTDAAVRGMVRAGFVQPTRGPRGALLFTFQDVIVVKTASRLLEARVTTRRIATALRRLREQLPDGAPLTRLSIAHEGDRIVVSEAGATREASSGQYLLGFDVEVKRTGEVEIIEAGAKTALPAESDCDALFERALSLEDVDSDIAMDAYRQCLAKSDHPGARVNLGRLLHEQGRIEEAVEQYRGIAEPDAVVRFNLGVALEDLGRFDEAVASYEKALADDPDLADAHFNLARLKERAGDARGALRHWTAYRRLT